MHTYQRTHVHTLLLSWRCLTDATFYHYCFFNHSIAGWAYNQRQLAWTRFWLAVCLTDWLVVSLPYCGVYCFNADLGGYQINRMNSAEVVTHGSGWKSTGVVTQCEPGEIHEINFWSGGESWRSSLVDFEITIGSEPFPRVIFCVLISCVCIQYMYLFALINYKENISIFCNCSLMCHNSCFLAHC